MDAFSDPRLLLLFVCAIPVGVLAILLGATQFLSLPIFQLLLPELTLGAIVANMKVGSVLRNLIALKPLRHHIRPRELRSLLVPLCVGGAIGALGVANVSQAFLVPALLVAIAVTEGAPYLGKRLTTRQILVLSFLAGIFGGILGAGISVIILALLRIRTPDDAKILEVRAQGVFLELATTAASIVAFALQNQLILAVWVTWAAGAMIGGYIGGRLLEHTGKFSPRTQKMFLRAAYLVALAVATARLLG